MIGGDFNERIGLGGRIYEVEKEHWRKKSKDKITNAEGRSLLEWVEKNGWSFLNGNMEGDKEEEFTYIEARGNSVIDCIIENEQN